MGSLVVRHEASDDAEALRVVVSDVDALTGMPYAMEGARAPFAGARAGAEDAPPALTLTRAVGLTGEFPGAVAWCPDGNTVAYPVNSLVALHDVRTGTQSHLFDHTDRVHLTCFSRDGRVLVTGQRGRHPADGRNHRCARGAHDRVPDGHQRRDSLSGRRGRR